jgi:hypothetical protein
LEAWQRNRHQHNHCNHSTRTCTTRGDLIVAAAIIKQQSCSGKVLVENQKQQNEKTKIFIFIAITIIVYGEKQCS